MLETWKIFIENNINSCETVAHCDTCHKLIELFDDKFKNLQESSQLKDKLKDKRHELIK